MEIADVVKIRNAFAAIKDANGDPCGIAIVGDNMVLADENFDFLKWDDEAGMLYIIRQNPEKRQNARIQVRATSYENIQYISANVDKSRFPAFAKGELGFTDTQVFNALRKYFPNDEDFIVKVSETKGKDMTKSQSFK